MVLRDHVERRRHRNPFSGVKAAFEEEIPHRFRVTLLESQLEHLHHATLVGLANVQHSGNLKNS